MQALAPWTGNVEGSEIQVYCSYMYEAKNNKNEQLLDIVTYYSFNGHVTPILYVPYVQRRKEKKGRQTEIILIPFLLIWKVKMHPYPL